VATGGKDIRITITVAPWLHGVVFIYLKMRAMGYRIEEEDIQRLIRSALIATPEKQ
jgi:hypothetical protein